MLMLQYEAARRKLDELAAVIQAEVLAMGESYTVGNVTARFSMGRRVFDYKKPCENVLPEIVAQYTKHIPASEEVDYPALCKAMRFEPLVVSQGDPSVTIVLKDGAK